MKALVSHEIMGASLLFGTWGLCYAFRPTQKLGGTLLARFPALKASAGPKAIEAGMAKAEVSQPN